MRYISCVIIFILRCLSESMHIHYKKCMQTAKVARFLLPKWQNKINACIVNLGHRYWESTSDGGKIIYWGIVNVEIIPNIICLGASSKLNRKWILASGRGLGSWSHSRTTPLMDNSKSGNNDQIPGKENFKNKHQYCKPMPTQAQFGSLFRSKC